MDWYRGEDAGDLKRSELKELVENLTCLNALERKIGKVIRRSLRMRKVGKLGKSSQKIVVNEKLVQYGEMNEKIVKNFVINSTIDPKVVRDLSIFKIGGWNSLQSINQKLLEEFRDEVEPWLLIGIPSRVHSL